MDKITYVFENGKFVSEDNSKKDIITVITIVGIKIAISPWIYQNKITCKVIVQIEVNGIHIEAMPNEYTQDIQQVLRLTYTVLNM